MASPPWRTRLSAAIGDATARLRAAPGHGAEDEHGDAACETPEALWSEKLRAAVGADLAEFVLDASDGAAGKSLSELSLPEDCVVISIHRGRSVVVPRGHTLLQAGDRLIVLRVCTTCDMLRALLHEGNDAAHVPPTACKESE